VKALVGKRVRCAGAAARSSVLQEGGCGEIVTTAAIDWSAALIDRIRRATVSALGASTQWAHALARLRGWLSQVPEADRPIPRTTRPPLCHVVACPGPPCAPDGSNRANDIRT
jgi:hypothetical protein